ncbi:protein dispatched homolog 3-like [Dendronephthya gigantea]|uniref:protein dispatched homolog 3-like n=1 Tax=Dendronephthya gigantea TaxID=151771 RepID=UPI001069C1B0|nr:protein dispatched homolog 3-like [Dendronephthya gigantea]
MNCQELRTYSHNNSVNSIHTYSSIMMANAREIGKINQGIILSSNEDNKDKPEQKNSAGNGLTLSTAKRESQFHRDVKQRSSQKPNLYCQFIVSHTSLTFGITFGAHIILLVLTVLLTVSGNEVIKFEFGRFPLEVPDDSSKLRTDAWLNAKDEISTSETSIQLPRTLQYQTIAMIYELNHGNVLTKENLQAIKQSEKEIFGHKTFQSELCQLQGAKNMTCKTPLSIISFFDGSYSNIHSDLYDPTFQNISFVLYTAQTINISRAILNFHLGKDAVIEKNTARSQYTRSLMYTGWPLEGYSRTNDKEREQEEKLNEIIVDHFSSTLKKKHDKGVGRMNFYYNNRALRSNAIRNQIIFDMMLAIASFAFIFIFSWFHTGSLWITAWGVFSIVSSFNITILIYRFVFDYRYFGIFHVLSIFIILGIGFDDVFIFMDTWRQSSKGESQNLVDRVSGVYRTAAKTTFVTSFTTMVAFLSNMQSPLLAIYSFGLFSAILIMVNYFSIIIFFPVVLILHHNSRRGRCCCARIQTKDETTSSGKISQCIIQFFQGWFLRNLIIHKVFRWVVVIIFVTIAAASVFFATKLEANKEQIKLWRSDSNWNKVRHIESNAFRKSQEDRVIIVYIIWGLKEQDRSECHHTDFACKGKTIFDHEFDLNSQPSQQAMLRFCGTMKNITSEQEKKLHLRRSQVTGEIEMKCIFQRMEEFFAEESNKTIYSTAVDFPLSEEKVKTLMKSNPDIYKVTVTNITRFFEVGAGFFMSQGGRKNYTSTFDYKNYKDLIKGVTYPHSFGNLSRENRPLYLAIAFNTSVDPSQLGYEKGLEIYDDWESFVNQKMNDLPPSCNKGFQATVKPFNVWQWLKVQKLLVNNAITGIIIGLICSLVVLTFATTNVIIGVMATLTIAMVTCGVLAMISVVGWSLGVLESLNLTLIVGLAVDYVVHLAEGYMVLEDQDRVTRVKYTLGHVGISVFSGACTTLGSSIFMLAAKILFFSQFGIFIFCTIALSILHALFFFTTVLALIGPENETGSLRPFMRRVKKLFCCEEADIVNANAEKENRLPKNDFRNGLVVNTKL